MTIAPPSLPTLHKFPDSRKAYHFPDTASGIYSWSKPPFSWTDCFITVLNGMCYYPDEFLDEGQVQQWETAQRAREVWRAHHIFFSSRSEVKDPRFWESCPLKSDEFDNVLSVYYERLKKKLCNFEVGRSDLFPVADLTQTQQMSYIRMLANANPRLLAQHIRSWTCTEPQIEEAVKLIFQKDPSCLLLVGASQDDLWSDQKSHPELVVFLQKVEKDYLCHYIERNPEAIRHLADHLKRLNIEFSSEKRDEYFCWASAQNPAFAKIYGDILRPSDEAARLIHTYILERGCEGAVDLFLYLQRGMSKDEEIYFLERLIQSCPEQVLFHLREVLNQQQTARVFKKAVSRLPQNCMQFNHVFIKDLTPSQRKQIVKTVYLKYPEALRNISYSGLQQKEIDELREREDWIAWRRLCLNIRTLPRRVSYHFTEAEDKIESLIQSVQDGFTNPWAAFKKYWDIDFDYDTD